MPSFLSRLMPPLMLMRGSKKIFSTEEATLAHVAELALRPTSYCPPKKMEKSLALSVTRRHGWPVYEVKPKNSTPTRCAIYVHGGAWIREITSAHWKLIAELVAATSTRFLVPIYPLAPTGTAGTVVPQIAELAMEVCANTGAGGNFIIGDSAGANIALAVAMQRRDHGEPAFSNTILISPALDLHFTDPLIKQIEPLDPMLALPGIRAAANLWRGDLHLSDPLVSPMFGKLDKLGPMTMFSGTHDAAHGDAIRFSQLARAAGIPLHFEAAENMLHVYPLMPIPEGKQARDAIKKALTA